MKQSHKKDLYLNYNKFINFKKKFSAKKNRKNAIVVGGSGRIGSVFMGDLLTKGYQVICLSRSNKKFKKYKKELPKNLQSKLVWSQIDVSDTPKIKIKAKKIINKIKKIDILVNCASSGNRGKNFEYNDKSIINEFNRVLGGTILFTEEILKNMRKYKNGIVINVCSLWGKVAPNFNTYLKMDIGPSALISSGNSGLIQYTKHLAVRESKFNIRVNNLIPGFFPRKGPVENKNYINSINNKLPLSRIGKLSDLITPVDFLTSEGSTYFSGHSLIIDGGYSIW